MASLSLLVCAKNADSLIQSLFDNISAQVNADFEVVFVNNASSDSTHEIVMSFMKYSRFPLKYVYEPVSGLAYARNSGLKQCLRDYTLILDADNRLNRNDSLSTLCKLIDRLNMGRGINNPVPLIFLSTIGSTPNPTCSSKCIDTYIDTQQLLSDVNGEYTPCFNSSILSYFHYPEFPGVVTENPTVLYTSILTSLSETAYISSLVCQEYNNSCNLSRISTRPIFSKKRVADMAFGRSLIISQCFSLFKHNTSMENFYFILKTIAFVCCARLLLIPVPTISILNLLHLLLGYIALAKMIKRNYV